MKTGRMLHAHAKRLLLFVSALVVFNLSQGNTRCIYTGSHDSIIVNISQSSRNYKVKLYPNATQEVLFFTAEGEPGKIYQFFLFDMDGKLIKQTQVRNRETTLLARFDKGSYLFEVFSNDERIQNGSILIK